MHSDQVCADKRVRYDICRNFRLLKPWCQCFRIIDGLSWLKLTGVDHGSDDIEIFSYMDYSTDLK